MDRDQLFRNVLLRFAHAFFCQTSQTALCNALHEVEQRLARWLLVSHDRDEHDELPLTHEFLARMLGTNRATISLNAELLKKAGIIDYRRGRVRVLDRQALKSVSCPCYREVQQRYREIGIPA